MVMFEHRPRPATPLVQAKRLLIYTSIATCLMTIEGRTSHLQDALRVLLHLCIHLGTNLQGNTAKLYVLMSDSYNDWLCDSIKFNSCHCHPACSAVMQHEEWFQHSLKALKFACLYSGMSSQLGSLDKPASSAGY